jgi:hypothetical protein
MQQKTHVRVEKEHRSAFDDKEVLCTDEGQITGAFVKPQVNRLEKSKAHAKSIVGIYLLLITILHYNYINCHLLNNKTELKINSIEFLNSFSENAVNVLLKETMSEFSYKVSAAVLEQRVICLALNSSRLRGKNSTPMSTKRPLTYCYLRVAFGLSHALSTHQ